jgi:hypothetical protein
MQIYSTALDWSTIRCKQSLFYWQDFHLYLTIVRLGHRRKYKMYSYLFPAHKYIPLPLHHSYQLNHYHIQIYLMMQVAQGCFCHLRSRDISVTIYGNGTTAIAPSNCNSYCSRSCNSPVVICGFGS